MACDNAPCGVVVEDAALKKYIEPSTSGSDVSNIPVKVGEPLSSSCQRATTIGSIPEVIRHPAFTVINGGVSASKHSNGGVPVGGLAKFLLSPQSKASDCFSDLPSYGSTCA